MIEEENSLPSSQAHSFRVLTQSLSFDERLQTQTQPEWAVPLQVNRDCSTAMVTAFFSTAPLMVAGTRVQEMLLLPPTPQPDCWGSASTGRSFETHKGSWNTFKITASSDLLLPGPNRLFRLSHFCVIPHCLIPPNFSYGHLYPLLCSCYYSQSPVPLFSLNFS